MNHELLWLHHFYLGLWANRMHLAGTEESSSPQHRRTHILEMFFQIHGFIVRGGGEPYFMVRNKFTTKLNIIYERRKTHTIQCLQTSCFPY